MAGINGIGGLQNNYDTYAKRLSSGTKLNSAADGAAELAISQKLKKEIGGYNAGSGNIKNGSAALNISDGALGGIADYLQQIRELALKASNGTASQSDKKSIQGEIDQLKQGIGDALGQARYNETDLLAKDGRIPIYTGPDGQVTQLTMGRMDTDALGIKDFNVLENFDISSIDNALKIVSTQRSQNGAEANGLEHTYNINQVAAENLEAADSDIADTEMVNALLNMRKEQDLESVRLEMQKKQQEEEEQKNRGILAAGTV